MDKKQVMVVALLIVAIVLSGTSIALNLSLTKTITPFAVDSSGSGNIQLAIEAPSYPEEVETNGAE